jgi:DNA-binding IclR family transcriptional regulator
MQARPYLEELWEEVDETVHLALPQGTQVLFVDCLEARRELRVASRTGTLIWAHCTSIGKAYLAFEPEERLVGLYPNEELPGLTPNSITSRTRLFEALAKVRGQGYAFNANESEEGLGSVAAPILGADGRAVASVNTAAPLVRLMDERRENVVAATVRCAQQIAKVLLSQGPAIDQGS